MVNHVNKLRLEIGMLEVELLEKIKQIEDTYDVTIKDIIVKKHENFNKRLRANAVKITTVL